MKNIKNCTCKVKWTFIQVEGNLSKTILKKVAKFGFKKFGNNVIYYYSANIEIINAAIEILKQYKKNGIATIITDKQYSLINNSWNGFAKSIASPFKYSIVVKDDNFVKTVPVTELQIKNSIKF